MIHLILHWLVTTLGVIAAAKLIPGVRVQGFGSALAVAAVFGVLNALFGHVLFLVFGIATLGVGFVLGFLTRWVVNTLLLKLADAFVGGFKAEGWLPTAFAALVISGVSAAARYVIH